MLGSDDATVAAGFYFGAAAVAELSQMPAKVSCPEERRRASNGSARSNARRRLNNDATRRTCPGRRRPVSRATSPLPRNAGTTWRASARSTLL